jgi:phosphoribosylglycinamide formyltransferase-1
MERLKLAILVSTRGTVLKTVLRACGEGIVAGDVVAVASNRPCPALDVAREAGVPHVASYPFDAYASRSARDAAMAEGLALAGANFVVVGGYSEVLEDDLVSRYPDRIISMYPAILPAFEELGEAIGPALERGVKLVGVTIHFRGAGTLSGGPIVAQEPLAVETGETVEDITSRVVELESRFLPRVLAAFAEGRVHREGDRVRVTGGDEHRG